MKRIKRFLKYGLLLILIVGIGVLQSFSNRKNERKKVSEIVKLLISEWGDTKNKIIVKKNKKFHESHLLSLNINKAKKELNCQPRLTLNETIKFTVDWYKSYFLNKEVEDISQLQIDYFTKKQFL